MMISRGYDYVATGHYARLRQGFGGQGLIAMAHDSKKDQSYFLAQVPSAKLAKALFPLGEMTKTEVREKARELGLAVSDKPDSMGICFVGEVDVPRLLRNKMGIKTGKVLLKGKVVGEHQGIWTATVGERVGQVITLNTKQLKVMGIDTTNMPSWYVIGKNTKDNQILIGGREECLRRAFELERLSSTYDDKDTLQALIKQKQLSVRVRNLGELYVVTKLVRQDNGGVLISTNEPVFAPSPGQLAVLYWQESVSGDNLVVAWGEIA
jgi:tRNA-specific 2-thiouridylase